MKRLLCLIGNMNSGGAETFLMKIYRQLDRQKYQMDFCINVKEKCFYEDEINSLGGKIFRIPSKSENMKEFRKQLYDVVKSNGYKYVLRITANTMGFMDVKIAKKAGAEVCVVRSSNSSGGGSLKVALLHKLGKLLYGRYVDVKIAPSDLAAKYTFGERAYKKGDVTILHNAVDLDYYSYSYESGQALRAELGIPSDAKVFGHIGRFMEQKNHSFLLDIFSEIHKKDRSAVLLLIGKGELENQIRDKVNALALTDSVIFAGVRRDIPACLSSMDAFVFPSFYEGMPNTVIEAQATGLPCVIADTITREADITGLVEYLPLSESAEVWAEKAKLLSLLEKRDTKLDFIDNKYDIGSTVKIFVNSIFGEDK